MSALKVILTRSNGDLIVAGAYLMDACLILFIGNNWLDYFYVALKMQTPVFPCEHLCTFFTFFFFLFGLVFPTEFYQRYFCKLCPPFISFPIYMYINVFFFLSCCLSSFQILVYRYYFCFVFFCYVQWICKCLYK